MDELKKPIEGYVRSETVLPIQGGQIMKIPELPARRVMALKTPDGDLALGVTAESAKDIAKALMKAAKEMEQEQEQMRKESRGDMHS